MHLIWNKYPKIKEINTKQNIKTYLTRIEPLVKEITPENKDDFYEIYESLFNLKNELNIYDIIVENDNIYIILDNNRENNDKIDELITSKEFNAQKEAVLQGHGEPIKKEEIINLFKMEESMCRIEYERINNNKIEKGKGTGFFCEISDKNTPIKYCLFTNNHVLNQANIEVGNIVNFEYYKDGKYEIKEIKIDENRKTYTNETLDYTCIEILESDGIKHFFKIDPYLNKCEDISYLKDNEIFILQYPLGNEICTSFGKILSIEDNRIKHSASTNKGSSGSPIIRRSKNFFVIGIHRSSNTNNKYNIATNFISILEDIKGNEINCIYIPKDNDKEIDLLHNYNKDLKYWPEESKKIYLEAKEINEKLFQENIELYINDKKINFDFKYVINDSKIIKAKFKFKKKLTNTSYMFYSCNSLKSVDLSLFNTKNVTNMCSMFSECHHLKSIDLSSFNTRNVTNISSMFSWCYSLKTIDLSSFNTNNVTNMSYMFYYCSSLESIDISSFNISKVQNFDLDNIFQGCESLKRENIKINENKEISSF